MDRALEQLRIVAEFAYIAASSVDVAFSLYVYLREVYTKGEGEAYEGERNLARAITNLCECAISMANRYENGGGNQVIDSLILVLVLILVHLVIVNNIVLNR